MGFFIAVNAQGFSDPIVINNNADGAVYVYAADLDGDGDMDVLSASEEDEKIAWYENDGNGNFSAPKVLATNVDDALSVLADDLDGDGDMDVVYSSIDDDYNLIWLKNDGNGNFGSPYTINGFWAPITSIHLNDLDEDGDIDLLVSDYEDLTWLKNDGNGNFGNQLWISGGWITVVDIADMDNDGDMDVISNDSWPDSLGNSVDVIEWYENTGNGNFSGAQILIETDCYDFYCEDIDGDEDMDIIISYNNKIRLFENDGNVNFEESISINCPNVNSIYPTDIDGDNDVDILSTSDFNDNLSWYENDGSGNFGSQNIITTDINDPRNIFAANLDGDIDIDVLTASYGDDKIAWYKNNLFNFSSPQNVDACSYSTAEFSIEDATNVQSYQWQILNGSAYENLTDNENYSGTTTNVLTIENVTMEMNGNHYRCMLNIGGNGIASNDAVLTVLPVPETGDIIGEPNPEPYQTYTYTVPNPNNSTFEWTVEGGSVISGTENTKDILWGAAGYGNLEVVETAVNGCHGMPVQLTITIDVDEFLAKYNIRVFPNPTSGKLWIEGDKIQKIEILSAKGNHIRSIGSKSGNYEIDLSKEPKGVYFIQFTLKDKVFSRKLILE